MAHVEETLVCTYGHVCEQDTDDREEAEEGERENLQWKQMTAEEPQKLSGRLTIDDNVFHFPWFRSGSGELHPTRLLSPAIPCAVSEVAKYVPLRTLNGSLAKPASKRIYSINCCRLGWALLQPLEIKVNTEGLYSFDMFALKLVFALQSLHELILIFKGCARLHLQKV